MLNATTVTVTGHIVDPPQLRTAGDAGTPVTTFRVVSTSRRYVKARNQWELADTMFLRVSCWRELAENVAVSLGKGDPVIIHGRMAQRDYEAEGRRHSSLDLDAYAVGPDLSVATVVITKRTKQKDSSRTAAAELAAGRAAKGDPVAGAGGVADGAGERAPAEREVEATMAAV